MGCDSCERIVVWDPMSHENHLVTRPPASVCDRFFYGLGMVLLPEDGGGDDNAAGRGFRVAVALVEEGVAVGAVYSSGTGAWANHVITAPAPASSRVLWKEKPGAVVGDTVYSLLNDDRVLSLELRAGGQQVLSVLEPAAGNVPSVYAQNAQLMTATAAPLGCPSGLSS